MFETEQLRDEFDDILAHRREAADGLEKILAAVDDPDLRQKLAEIYEHAQRNVELSERLVEIVS